MNDNDNKTPTPNSQKPIDPNSNKNPLPNLMPNKNNKNGNVIAIIISVIGLILLVTLLPNSGSVDGFINKEKPKSFSDLATEIRAGKVSKLTLSEDREKFEAEIYSTLENNRSKVEKKIYENGVLSGQESLQAKLKSAVDDKIKFGTENGAIDLEEKKPNALVRFLFSSDFLTC